MYNWRRWRRCAAAWLGAALFVLCETRFVCSFFTTDSLEQQADTTTRFEMVYLVLGAPQSNGFCTRGKNPLDAAPCFSKFNYCFESQVQNDGVATKLRILIVMHFLRLQARARLHKPTATLRSFQLCRGSSPISLSMSSVSYVRSLMRVRSNP